jgi:hypothetical protein
MRADGRHVCGEETRQHQAAKPRRQIIDHRLNVAQFCIDLTVGSAHAVRVQDERGKRDENPGPRPQRVVRDVEEERREQ